MTTDQAALPRRHGRQPAAHRSRSRMRARSIATGEISDDGAARRSRIAEIRALIKQQEEIGLQAVTDGEFRRAFWHFDFLEHLDGVERVEADSGIHFKGGVGIPKALRVTGKIGFSGHPMIEHFRFLKDNADRARRR